MVIHDHFSDFVLFLYVYIAYVDGEFHPKEREVIMEKMHKLYPDSNDHEKRLADTIRVYSDLEQNQFKGIFVDTFKHFNKVKYAQKYRVYLDMYEVVQADGKVHEMEQLAMDALKEIIDISY
ncbi:MAG: TerB family tellurite resistance protein [Cyclobacteriaceae bacterium]|jgi:uncharacterized tellurite resistance protein B-like protein|nr:TerB family tellurite resistance protein [Cyclobacteriaceae bacterium]